jgi:hypothetical protein
MPILMLEGGASRCSTTWGEAAASAKCTMRERRMSGRAWQRASSLVDRTARCRGSGKRAHSSARARGCGFAVSVSES